MRLLAAILASLMAGCSTVAPVQISQPAAPAAPILGDRCVEVGKVARAAAGLRDAGIRFDWRLEDPILYTVAIDSAKWKLETPAHNAEKFLTACLREGFESMPKRLLELEEERELWELRDAFGSS